MKKLIVFSLFLFVGLSTTYAQSAKKSCSATCTKSAKKCDKGAKASTTATLESQDPQTLKAAMAAAEADDMIEQKVCTTSGKVSFTKKNVCSTSGKVSYSDVSFEPATGAFVNVAPSEMKMDGEKMTMKDGKKSCAATCAKSGKKCDKGAKASTTATLESQDPQTLKAAMAAAEADDMIEQKVCSTSGKVSFTKKSVCSTSGKVSYSDVSFEPATGAFVNVAPSEMKMEGKKSCAAKSAKKCDKGAKASTTALSDKDAKKSCAAKCAKSGKKCDKGAKASTTATLESQDPQTLKAAMAAAEADDMIEQKVCSTSGKVSFTKKKVCSTSGKVSYSDVAFEPATGAFVNVSPSEMKMGNKEAKPMKACCAASQGKCCASKAKTMDKAEAEMEKTEAPVKMQLKKASMDN